METAVSAKTAGLTQNLFDREQIETHPLFVALAEDRLSLEQIQEAGLQIYHVVLHFPRFLSAILTSIPDYAVRMPLVENLFEEHGKMNEAYVHSQTYKKFLLGIGISEQRIADSRPIVPVLAYNRAMTDLCLHHHFIEGLSALGVVEEIVARVSPLVARYALRKFSGEDPSLFHFTSHETLDITHAQEIYALADLYLEKEPVLVQQGFELGMYYHKRLYTDIWAFIQAK